jgi:hypothetical protein
VHELRFDVDDPRRRGLRRESTLGIVDCRLQARTRRLQFVDPCLEQRDPADLGARFFHRAARLRLGLDGLALRGLQFADPQLQLTDAYRFRRGEFGTGACLVFGALARDTFSHGQLLVRRFGVTELLFEVAEPPAILLATVKQFRHQRRHAHRAGPGWRLVEDRGEFFQRRTPRKESLRPDFGGKGLVLRAFDAERMQQHRQVHERRVLAQPAAQCKAVEPRQHHVAHERIGIPGANEVEGLDASLRLEHAVTARLQHALDGCEILVAFVGKQHGLH